MGYSTDFSGQFDLVNKPLSDEDYEFLVKFNQTRRMKRNVGGEFGVEGEFYVDGDGLRGQAVDGTVIDHNRPPATQPGLWCGWMPTEDRTAIEWDGGEKFYDYVEWIQYLINSILAPRGYILSGDVYWDGEESDDKGLIEVRDNVVTVKYAQIEYV